MKVKLSCILLFLSFPVLAQSQVSFTEGDKQLEIAIDPLFDYLGQMFSNEGADLYLNTNRLTYRIFKNEQRALRLNLNVGFRHFEDSNGNVDEFTNSTQSRITNTISLQFGIGNEWHFPKGKWNFYGGWNIQAGVLHSSTERERIDISDESYEREVERRENDWTFSFGPTALGGIQYHFNNVIYTGVEVNAFLNFSYQTAADEIEEWYVAPNQAVPSRTESVSAEPNFNATLSSSNLVSFRFGVKF
jgi:hypothetical protein